MAIRVKPPARSRNQQIIDGLRELARADAPSSPEMAVKRKAAEIATLMAQIHDGHFQVTIDHDLRFVQIAPLAVRL